MSPEKAITLWKKPISLQIRSVVTTFWYSQKCVYKFISYFPYSIFKMPTSCCAVGCTNHLLKKKCIERKVSFHKFPHPDPELMKEWLARMNRENFVPTSGTKICSDHFEPHLFHYEKNTNRRLLVKGAIPTIFSSSKPVLKRKRCSDDGTRLLYYPSSTPNMKPPTLFSLKKTTPEEVIKRKVTLDNQAGVKQISVARPATFKKRNPTKDIRLSSRIGTNQNSVARPATFKKIKPAKDIRLSTGGIDASLNKMVTEHHSSLVTNEVKNLLILWKVEAPVKKQYILVQKPTQPLVATNLKNKYDEIKKTIILRKKSDPVAKVEHLTMVPETQSNGKLSILKVVSKSEEKKEESKTNTANQIYKMQTEKIICKKFMSDEERETEIYRRLRSAVTLFLEQLGKEEVKMYLDDLALKCCNN